MEKVEQMLQQASGATQPTSTSSMMSGSATNPSSSGILSNIFGGGAPTTPSSSQYGGSTIQQTQQGIQQSVQSMTSRFQNILNLIQRIGCNVMDNLRLYVNQYPPLAAFLFTLVALSIVPISIFLLFAAASIAVTLSTALIGFGLVEGFLLLTSGGLLALILGGVTICTGVGFTWLFGIWIAYRGACYLYNRVGGTAGSLSESVTGTFRQMGQQLRESVQGMGSTASQTAAPLTSAFSGQQQPSYGGPSQQPTGGPSQYQPSAYQQQPSSGTSAFVPSTATR